MKHPDVAILGGGVIGLTTAYFLAREGVNVQLFDRTIPGTEASWAGAGIIPPGNAAGAATAFDRLRATSSEAYQGLSDELRECTGIDNGYRVCGGIEVLEADFVETTRLWQEEEIVFEPISSEEVHGRAGSLKQITSSAIEEPNLRLPPGHAFVLPRMAQVRNPWHLRALIAACRSLGVRIIQQTRIVELSKSGNHVQSARDERGFEYSAGKFLIASGAWSDQICASLGVEIGIHPVLGQMALFRPPRLLLHRIVTVNKQYLVPRADGRILAGSTEEPEAGFEKRTSDAGIKGLFQFATALVPELTNVPIEKTWAGLRPGSNDGFPYLGQIPGYENAYIAAGHFRAGIQLSPATARVMCEVLTERVPSIPLEDFRVDRPPSKRVPVAFRS